MAAQRIKKVVGLNLSKDTLVGLAGDPKGAAGVMENGCCALCGLNNNNNNNINRCWIFDFLHSATSVSS